MAEYSVLIPAYQPDKKLIDLVNNLFRQNIDVTVVDDGSGPKYAPIFDRVAGGGAAVLHHKENKGKGAALKTGISALMAVDSLRGIITADADGQHTQEDISRIIGEMQKNPGVLIIGTRSFSGKMPLRSRLGNTVTQVVFRFATGLKISDTQTGMRGIPRNLFGKLATLKGNRYEYEMNMLLNIKKWEIQYMEVPIKTVYIEGNASSHFHPLRDSWLIYGKILKFCASSFVSYLIDFGAYALFGSAFLMKPWMSYASARFISSFINYSLNRHVVFGKGGKNTIIKYYVLALGIMLAGSAGVDFLTIIGIHSILAKILIDTPLFLISYTVQRKYVFKPDAGIHTKMNLSDGS